MEFDPFVSVFNPLHGFSSERSNDGMKDILCIKHDNFKRIDSILSNGNSSMRLSREHKSSNAQIDHQIEYGSKIKYSRHVRDQYFKNLNTQVSKNSLDNTNSYLQSLEALSIKISKGLRINSSESLTCLNNINSYDRCIMSKYYEGKFFVVDTDNKLSINSELSLEEIIGVLSVANGIFILDIISALRLIQNGALVESKILFDDNICILNFDEIKAIKVKDRIWNNKSQHSTLKATIDRRPFGACFTFMFSENQECIYCLKVASNKVIVLSSEKPSILTKSIAGKPLLTEIFVTEVLDYISSPEDDNNDRGNELTLVAIHKMSLPEILTGSSQP